MKKKWFLWLATIALVSFLWSCSLEARSIEWDANTDDAVGYKIYYGDSSGNYQHVVDVGNKTTYLLSDLPDLPDNQVNYFALKAYDTSGNESVNFSDEVTNFKDTIPPGTVGVVRIVK